MDARVAEAVRAGRERVGREYIRGKGLAGRQHTQVLMHGCANHSKRKCRCRLPGGGRGNRPEPSKSSAMVAADQGTAALSSRFLPSGVRAGAKDVSATAT